MPFHCYLCSPRGFRNSYSILLRLQWWSLLCLSRLLSAFYHPLDSYSLFSHPLSKWLLKGVFLSYPPVHCPHGSWYLPLVLRCLTRCPFEPAATCNLKMLSLKMLFFVAITLVRRVSELAALDSRLPFMTFLLHAIQIAVNLTFLPKVVFSFHLQSNISLLGFYPNPKSKAECLLHSFDVTRVMKFYLNRTKFPDRDPHLFVSYAARMWGNILSGWQN